MKDPVTIDGGVIDRAALVGVIKQDDRLLLFLRGCRPINLPDRMSREEFEELTKKSE